MSEALYGKTCIDNRYRGNVTYQTFDCMDAGGRAMQEQLPRTSKKSIAAAGPRTGVKVGFAIAEHQRQT